MTLPEQIGRYAVLGLLGTGGMARVFLGRTVGPGRFERLAAIKMIRRDLSSNPDFMRMLLDEAWIAARIQHPNVISVHEVDQHESQYYLVMDYVSGEGLDRVIAQLRQQERRLPWDLVAYVGMEIADALHAVHDLRDLSGNRLHVVHRDITPQNIMIGYDGTVRLMDFGVAKASERIQRTTDPGVLKGRLGYVSPEQITARVVDHRADIFSLGVVLWEAIVGQRLFQNDLPGMMQLLLGGAIPRPSAFVGGCPPELDSIIMQSLKLEPNERIQSARELGQRMRRMLMESRQCPSEAALEVFMRAVFPDRFQKLDAIIRRAAALDLTARPNEDLHRIWSDLSDLVIELPEFDDEASDLDDEEPTHIERREPQKPEGWDAETTPVAEPESR